MKRIIFIILVMLLYCTSCFAHKAIGYKPERTMAVMDKIEAYFQTHYNLSLKNAVTIYVTKTHDEYVNVLKRNNVQNLKQIASGSYAVASANHNILIDGSPLGDKHFEFILAQEIVHKYQMENSEHPDTFFKDADYVLMEGHADIIASDISGYWINSRDHGIGYKHLKNRNDFFNEVKRNSEYVLEEIRYHAKKVPFETTIK